MCSFCHRSRADVSTACVLCITLQRWRDCSPLLRRETRRFARTLVIPLVVQEIPPPKTESYRVAQQSSAFVVASIKPPSSCLLLFSLRHRCKDARATDAKMLASQMQKSSRSLEPHSDVHFTLHKSTLSSHSCSFLVAIAQQPSVLLAVSTTKRNGCGISNDPHASKDELDGATSLSPSPNNFTHFSSTFGPSRDFHHTMKCLWEKQGPTSEQR